MTHMIVRIVFASITCAVVSLLPQTTLAAGTTIFVSPQSGSFAVGESFDVRVLLDSGGELVTAAEAELSFDPRVMRVKNISAQRSVITTWVAEPGFSNERGTISFSGITKTPYKGKNGLLTTVTFVAQRNMLGDVKFNSGSVLSAGSDRSNVLSVMRSGSYRVEPREIEAVPVPPSATPTTAVIRQGTTANIVELSKELAAREAEIPSSLAAAAAYTPSVRDMAIFLAILIISGAVLTLGFRWISGAARRE